MSETEVPGGNIHEMDILNLLSAQTAEDLKGIASISEVGVVLVPEHLAIEITKIPMQEVGSVVAVPGGDNIVLQIGQSFMPGEALAAGGPEKILVAVGQLVLTTIVPEVGYKGIHMTGQLIAVRGSEKALVAKLLHNSGQIFYIPANSRFILGEDTLGKEFLELLPEPISLVIMGNLTLEKEISVELFRSKISEIVLFGQLNVPKTLVPVAQLLTKDKYGEIHGYE